MTLAELFQSIADAIKGVNGSNTKMKPNQFASEISKLCKIDGVTGKVNKVDSATPVITIDGNKITAKTTQSTGYVSDGGSNATVSFPSKSAETYTPTTTNQVIKSGQYLSGNQTILGDIMLDPSNILRGKNNKFVSIFGVKGELDKIHKMRAPIVRSNHDILVLDVAKSYYITRANGTVKWVYSQSMGPFYSKLTNSSGYCGIDCSTYADLYSRGIEYKNSPYYGKYGTANASSDKTQIKKLADNSPYAYADKYMDRQADPSFWDTGNTASGYYSIRNAAQIAEYFYCKGNTLYEYDSDPTSLPTGLKGGELVFWSKPLKVTDSDGSTTGIATEGQKSRFKGISHIGIIDRTGERYYQVTSDPAGNTIIYSKLAEHLQYISLIVKPSWGPDENIQAVEVGKELLPKFAYDDCGTNSTTKNGTTFKINTDGGFTISKNVPTASTTFYIIDDSKGCLLLQPGTYKLSGVVKHEKVTTDSGTKWGISIKDKAGNHIKDTSGNDVWDRGFGGSTFKITKPTEVYVYFYLSSNIGSMTGTYSMIPSLKRTA